MAVKTFLVDIVSELKTEEDIVEFIEASIEEAKNDTDPKYLIHALRTAARARDMLKTTKGTEVDPASICFEETDPSISVIAKIANELGYRLTFVKKTSIHAPDA